MEISLLLSNAECFYYWLGIKRNIPMKGIFDVGHDFQLPLFADTLLSIQTMAFVLRPFVPLDGSTLY